MYSNGYGLFIFREFDSNHGIFLQLRMEYILLETTVHCPNTQSKIDGGHLIFSLVAIQ